MARPLRFFHFSGFDPAVPYLLSRHQGRNPRVLLSEQPALRELCDALRGEAADSGHRPAAVTYGFATLPDGTPIDPVMRRLYRRALLDAERLGLPPPPWPFEMGRDPAVAQRAGAGGSPTLALPFRAPPAAGRYTDGRFQSPTARRQTPICTGSRYDPWAMSERFRHRSGPTGRPRDSRALSSRSH